MSEVVTMIGGVREKVILKGMKTGDTQQDDGTDGTLPMGARYPIENSHNMQASANIPHRWKKLSRSKLI